MGDIVLWRTNVVQHIAIYLGRAPVSTTLERNTPGLNEFVWHNSGLSSWDIPLVQGFMHIAPFDVLNRNTSGQPEIFRPNWLGGV